MIEDDDDDDNDDDNDEDKAPFNWVKKLFPNQTPNPRIRPIRGTGLAKKQTRKEGIDWRHTNAATGKGRILSLFTKPNPQSAIPPPTSVCRRRH